MAGANQTEIVIIAAMSANRVIGRDNAIPWHIPEELLRFKKTTWGYPLVMGRRTYLSIGRPLPGRMNIIVTQNKKFEAAGCEVAASIEQALTIAAGYERVFVIGGEQVFIHTLSIVDTILLTVLPWEIEGDTFFPEIPDDFVLDRIEKCPDDEPYKIEIYRRKNI